LFARELSDQTGIAIVVSELLDAKTVTAEFKGSPIEEVLATVARRLDVQATLAGDTWFVGELRPEDRAVLVRRVGRLVSEDLAGAVTTLLSQFGRVHSYADGLVIVGDRVDVLERISAMLDELEANQETTWCLQLHLVGSSTAGTLDVGLEGLPIFDFALAASTAGASAPNIASARWAGLIKTTNERSTSSVFASPLLLLNSGRKTILRDGQELRIPRKTVSDQGTVQTIGFDIVNTGLEIETEIIEKGLDSAILDVSITTSELNGFSEGGSPIITRQSLKCAPIIKSGGIYLLGSITRHSSLEKTQWLLKLTDSKSIREVQIWGRIQKVGQGVRQ